MEYDLNNPIVERSTKTVYEYNGNTIKLFVENYSKANILNEALNQARVEEGTDLKIAKLKEVTTIKSADINKNGATNASTFIESSGASLTKTGNVLAKDMIEL